jgi:protein phosphatase
VSAPAAVSWPEGAIHVRVAALTDVGRTREHNEDAFLVGDLAAPDPLAFTGETGTPGDPREHLVALPHTGMLFLVADGLGGAAAGEVASHMAVRTVFDALRERMPDAATDGGAFAAALRDAALAANASIHHVAARNAELRGMGTTLTAAALLGDTLFLAQVGDSRAYLVRNGAAQQLTKDQSLMQRLLDAGEITPEQAETSARRNIILQALGPEPMVKVDITHQPVRRGDLLLLCSDGLSGQVRAETLAEAAVNASDLGELCTSLVHQANAAGGPDNITVVAVRLEGEGLSDAGTSDAVGHLAYPVTPTPQNPLPALSPDRAAAAMRSEAAATLATRGAPAAGAGAAAVVTAPDGAAPGVTAGELADRRDRARVAYLALGGLAILLGLLWFWHLSGQR